LEGFLVDIRWPLDLDAFTAINARHATPAR